MNDTDKIKKIKIAMAASAAAFTLSGVGRGGDSEKKCRDTALAVVDSDGDLAEVVRLVKVHIEAVEETKKALSSKLELGGIVSSEGGVVDGGEYVVKLPSNAHTEDLSSTKNS